jgi:hypothetical protein
MSDVYRIANLTTDVLAGRVFVNIVSGRATLAAGAGKPGQSAGADYVVPVGKTLTIVGVQISEDAAWTAGAYYELRYADDAALTTNPVTLANVAAAVAAGARILPIAGVTVPAGHYVGVFNNTGTNQFAALTSEVITGFEA